MPAASLGFLDECHEIVVKHLRPHIKKMFESSDLAFIEFAEKSQSSASQLRFFEAMTVIQKNRDNVEAIFYRDLGRSFADFGYGSDQSEQADYIDEDSLTLVSKEESDIKVAIQNMVASASLGSSQELIALRQRLAVLNNGQQLEERNIPGGPSCLANAFNEAASSLVLEHQTRLVVYMLFNKFVLSKTTPLYDEYNKHLLKAGLLPNLKYKVRIDPARAQKRLRKLLPAPPLKQNTRTTAASHWAMNSSEVSCSCFLIAAVRSRLSLADIHSQPSATRSRKQNLFLHCNSCNSPGTQKTLPSPQTPVLFTGSRKTISW